MVEPLIAASIVVAAALNLRDGGGVRQRLAVAFGFGLVHGLGFAGVLAELGIGGPGATRILPLAAFNVGVEAGQIAIASLALPVLARLRRAPALARAVAPACSALLCAVGTVWLIERLLLA